MGIRTEDSEPFVRKYRKGASWNGAGLAQIYVGVAYVSNSATLKLETLLLGHYQQID
jgi:hypothetical protein